LSPNICFSRLARSTFCQRPIRFPPERCAFSPPRSLEGILASSKLDKTTRRCAGCQPAEITGFPPVFNSAGSIHRRLGINQNWRTLLQHARKRSSALARYRNPAQAEAEEDSKIKDRWRLCSTRKPFRDIVPECEPRKGVSWRLTEFDAASRREDSTESSETLVHLSSTRSVIPKRLALRKGRIKKVTCVHGRDSREWSDVRPRPSTADLAAAASQPGGDAPPSTGKFVSQPIMLANP